MADNAGFIVVAVYRPRADLLQRQLQSIAAQSLTDWTCVIGVDGQDPYAAALAREAVGTDARFDVVQFPNNVGVYRHFERLLSLMPADVDWVALSDQDDYWYPRKLEVLVSELSGEHVTAVMSRARVVTADGVSAGLTQRRVGDLIDLLLLNQVTGSHAAFQAAAVRGAIPFPDGGPGAIHDHWLAVCAASRGQVGCVSSVLQDYVQHGANVIGESQLRSPSQVVVLALRGRFDIRVLVDRPWQWRSAMAQALMNRSDAFPRQNEVRRVANGRWSARLGRLLLAQAMRRRTPARVCVALAWGAVRQAKGSNLA